jgi:TRAP-type uncharacterized transport system fused permease subunit
MFILFFSAMATITPPVALTSFAAATIAEAPPMRVGFLSMKTGLVAYILPFVFIFNPAILMIGSWPETLMAFAAAVAGVKILSFGTEGWFRGRETGMAVRVLLSISGILVISGSLWNMAAAGLMILVLMGFQRVRNRQAEETGAVKREWNKERMEGIDEKRR